MQNTKTTRNRKLKKTLMYIYFMVFHHSTKGNEDFRRQMIMDYKNHCPYANTCDSSYQPNKSFTPTFPLLYSPCCNQCGCKEECIERDNCCPDSNVSSAKPKLLCRFSDTIEQIPRGVRILDIPKRFSFYMIEECLPFYNDSSSRLQCEINPLRFDDQAPVVSRRSGLVYKNKFCAACNNEASYDKFIPVFGTFLNINMSELEQQKFLMTAYFTQEQVIKYPLFFYQFLHPYQNESGLSQICYMITVDKCIENEGTKPDQYLDYACRSYTSPYIDKHEVYKNVHCFLCNEQKSVREMCFDAPQQVIQNNLLVILSYDKTLTEAVARRDGKRTCTVQEFFDPYQRICRRKLCPLSQHWQNGKCVSSVQAGQSLARSLKFLAIVDLSTNDTSGNKTKDIARNLLVFVKTQIILSNISNVTLCGAAVYTKTKNSDEYVLYYELERNKEDISRNISNLISILRLNHTFKLSNQIAFQLKFLSRWIYVLDRLSTVYKYDHKDTKEFDLDGETMTLSVYEGNKQCSSARFLILNLHTCPTIELFKHEINILNQAVVVKANALHLALGEYVPLVNSEGIMICVEDYLMGATSFEVSVQPLNIVSLACTTLSVACLLVILATYSMIGRLRSTPGKINMFLSATLLLAQVLEQVGIDLIEFPLTCKIIGAFIHYFWLSTIMWMNCASFHVYKTFGNPYVFTHIFSVLSPMTLYCWYSFLLPCLFVGLNVGIALYTSDGSDIGYGGQICYISNESRIGYTFSLPVGVVVMVDIILLLLAVYQIGTTPTVTRANERDQKNGLIFLKLSTLTGLCWVFGYLAIWTKIEVFAYLFVTFNASQGLFLFLAFVCNRRVLGDCAKQTFHVATVSSSNASEGNRNT